MSKKDARGILLAVAFFAGVLVVLSLTAGKTGATPAPARPGGKPLAPGQVVFTDVN